MTEPQPPNIVDGLTGGVVENAVRLEANRRGSIMVELAILTLLVDRGITTFEEAARRIEQIQRTLPEQFQDNETTLRITFVTEWLRAGEQQNAAQWQPEVIQGGLTDPPRSAPPEESDPE